MFRRLRDVSVVTAGVAGLIVDTLVMTKDKVSMTAGVIVVTEDESMTVEIKIAEIVKIVVTAVPLFVVLLCFIEGKKVFDFFQRKKHLDNSKKTFKP